ncbi:FkbM family methyltransferase [Prosthecobacter sp.]|uniref:FkbM family methyltransferase n=1 Tax=Prosthecobacter sp. TaxID=1965333 RepID=UPI0037833814
MNFPEFVYTVLLKPRPLKKLANRVLLWMLPERIKIGQAVVCLDPDDPVVSGASALGVYEKDELRFFQDHCRPGMVVVDVGANVGIYTAMALRLAAPDGRVISFEPNPHSRAFLEKTVAANAGGAASQIYPLALSDRDGQAELHLNKDNKGDNRLYASDLSSDSLQIQTRCLDSVLGEMGVHEIHFIKIDVQGCEPLVLTGAQETLRRSPNVMMMSEFWPQGMRAAGGASPRAYLDNLVALGFRLFTLKDGHLATLAEPAFDALIANLPDRQYANIVAAKGTALEKL